MPPSDVIRNAASVVYRSADNINEERAEFMVRHGLTSATWDEHGRVMTATRAPSPPPRPAPAAEPAKGPAAKMAEAFADRLKRQHETRFAASHFKPRMDAPATPADDVPRAVRAREVADGRTSNKPKRR